MVKDYDLISLNEIKTPLKISCPGHISITSRNMSNPHRGGTCVLIKNQLFPQVTDVDLSKPDQVWLRIRCVPGILFGFVYIPPSDSSYFSETSFSDIQEKLKTEKPADGCVIVGDVNARLGKKLRDLPEFLNKDGLSYPSIPNPIQTPNGNANIIFSICCEENLAVVNNAKIGSKVFKSNLTYKKGNNWVSELDLCLVSPDLLDYISDFNIIHDSSLPSDHAPLSFALQHSPCLNELLQQASFLGDHAVLYSRNKRSACKRPIKYDQINSTLFLDKLSQCDLPGVNLDLSSTVESVSRILYDCAADSKITTQPTQIDPHLPRWNQLLENSSDKQVWAAINWRGQLTDTNPTSKECPSDNQFKEFFLPNFRIRGHISIQ